MKGRGSGNRYALLMAACLGWMGCGSQGEESPASRRVEDSPAAPAPVPPESSNPAVDPPPAPAPDTGPQDPPVTETPPPLPAPARCAPTASGPYWLQEGEPLRFTVRCGTGLTDPGLRFTFSPLPTGASVDEAAGTFQWTPGKTQAAVYTLTVTERTTGETGTVKVGVADNFLAPGNVRELDPATYTEEYGLPVLHLSYEGDLTAGEYRPVQIVYRGHRYTLEAKYRGATSSSYPKRNYTFKFAEDDLFNEPTLAGGFTGRRTVVLITSFNDNSYLRPRLAFDLWNRMSADHIQIKTYSAVLYVNGRFKGLFTVADHVDKYLMKRHGLSKDGDLFKAVDGDANFSRLDRKGAPKQLLPQGFEKKEGLPESGPAAFATLDALTAFIADASDADFRAQFPARLNTQDYQDWWILNTAILGTDSSAKNAYHYFDPARPAPWRFIPWDLDASFGQLWDTHRIVSSALPNFAGENRLFARMLADPTLNAPLRERYRALLLGAMSQTQALGLIDGYEREIHAVALRDEAMWSQKYREFDFWKDRTDFTSYEQEVAYVRQWVSDRWSLLGRQLP